MGGGSLTVERLERLPDARVRRAALRRGQLVVERLADERVGEAQPVAARHRDERARSERLVEVIADAVGLEPLEPEALNSRPSADATVSDRLHSTESRLSRWPMTSRMLGGSAIAAGASCTTSSIRATSPRKRGLPSVSACSAAVAASLGRTPLIDSTSRAASATPSPPSWSRRVAGSRSSSVTKCVTGPLPAASSVR